MQSNSVPRGLATAGLWLILYLPLLAMADALPPVPNLEQEIQKFQTIRQKAQNGPMVTEADRMVMEQAAVDLAINMPNPGLAVGEKAPDFDLPNAFGKSVKLSQYLKRGPVVLTFYRGAWCPYCNLELRALHDSLPHFRRYGAELIAVTPQKPDKSLEQVKKDKYPFEILSDLDSSVMKAYRLYFEVPEALSSVYQRNFGLDLADYNGDGRYVLPVPGTFVIDTEATVRAAYANVDYKKRMEPADIIAALKGCLVKGDRGENVPK